MFEGINQCASDDKSDHNAKGCTVGEENQRKSFANAKLNINIKIKRILGTIYYQFVLEFSWICRQMCTCLI